MVLSYRARESRILAAMDDDDAREYYEQANEMSGRGFKKSLKKFGKKVSAGSRKVARAVKSVAKNPLVSALARDLYNDSLKPVLQGTVDSVVGKHNRQRLEELGSAAIDAAVHGKNLGKSLSRAGQRLVEREVQNAVSSGRLGEAIKDIAGEAFAPAAGFIDKNADLVQLVNQLRLSGYSDADVRQYLVNHGYLKKQTGSGRGRPKRKSRY